MNKPEIYDRVMAINVDVQNDFCPGGSLAVAEGDLVVPPLNEINRWVRDHEGDVIFTRDWHPKETAHFISGGGRWPDHCLQYKAGAAFHDDLDVLPTDMVASKGISDRDDGYSGWKAVLASENSLHIPAHYPRAPIDTVEGAVEFRASLWSGNLRGLAVLIGGLATDYCVKATVLDAAEHARELNERKGQELLGVFVIKDAIRAVELEPGDGEAAVAEMEAAGARFVSSRELLAGTVMEIGA